MIDELIQEIFSKQPVTKPKKETGNKPVGVEVENLKKLCDKWDKNY